MLGYFGVVELPLPCERTLGMHKLRQRRTGHDGAVIRVLGPLVMVAVAVLCARSTVTRAP